MTFARAALVTLLAIAGMVALGQWRLHEQRAGEGEAAAREAAARQKRIESVG